MAGYDVVHVGTDANGNVDLDDLRVKGDDGRRLPDADQPLDARPVRAGDRGDRADRPRRRRDALLRRRQPQRDHGHLPARRHGLRHRPLQPAQVVHPTPRRRRPGRRTDRGRGADRAVPAAPAGRARAPDGMAPFYDLEYDRPKSIGRLRGFQGNYGVFVRSYAYIRSLGARRAAGRVRSRGAERQLPAGASYAPRGCSSTCRLPTTGSACTSSCSPGRR